MADEMDVDQPKTKGKKEAKDSSKARFEVKKVLRTPVYLQSCLGSDYPSPWQWNAVSLWAWGESFLLPYLEDGSLIRKLPHRHCR
jgi:RING-box protein 1